MDETWHSLITEYSPQTNEIRADIIVGSQSPWFDGHFPDMPILPGIAQLALVSDIIRKHTDRRGIAELKRIRFRQLIRPDQPMTAVISADAAADGLFRFKLFSGDEIACNGVLLMK